MVRVAVLEVAYRYTGYSNPYRTRVMKSLDLTEQSPSQSLQDSVQRTTGLSAKAESYRKDGKSANTERAYKASVDHFRFKFGGMLPATTDSICNYLASYAGKLEVSTLRQRLSGLSKWHKKMGFPDPTASSLVTETMRGIAKNHSGMPKQAHPLTFRHLLAICDKLEVEKREAIDGGQQEAILRTHRDLALILLGFWQAFRSDELSRIDVAHVKANRNEGISIFLPYSKTDRNARGQYYGMGALRAYCPTSAYLDWLQVSGIKEGLAFRAISRWGRLSDKGIHKQSIEHILNRVATNLFPNEPKFSTHSLRRGFADWATREGWDLKTLMEHVGWRSVENAQRYIPTRKNFGSLAFAPLPVALAQETEDAGSAVTIQGSYTIQNDSM